MILEINEGLLGLPTLEETLEAVNTRFAKSCEELVRHTDYSLFRRVVNQQIKHSDEEKIDDPKSHVESDETNFDPQLFIRNFLNLSDQESDMLPALIPNETSTGKRVTLVLDLDGKFIILSIYNICYGVYAMN